MNENIPSKLLEQPNLVAPRSSPPTVNALHARVRGRRRRRLIFRASLIGAVVPCLIGVAAWRINVQHGLTVGRAESTVAELSVGQRQDPPPVSSLDHAPNMRVFATIRQPIPIFGLEEDTQYLHHVGWVDSEQIAPVDMSQLPLEQQKSVEAVLNDDDSPMHFSL